MSERMTVVFDDDVVARRLRVWSAEHGVPMKQVIQDAVREYLGPDRSAVKRLGKPFDWAAYDSWQEEVHAITDRLEPENIMSRRPPIRMMAEEHFTDDYGKGEGGDAE